MSKCRYQGTRNTVRARSDETIKVIWTDLFCTARRAPGSEWLGSHGNKVYRQEMLKQIRERGLDV